ADRTRDQNFDGGVVGHLVDQCVRQALSERTPVHQVAVVLAVRHRDRALRAAMTQPSGVGLHDSGTLSPPTSNALTPFDEMNSTPLGRRKPVGRLLVSLSNVTLPAAAPPFVVDHRSTVSATKKRCESRLSKTIELGTAPA